MSINEYVELYLHYCVMADIDFYCDEFDAPEGINESHMPIIINALDDELNRAINELKSADEVALYYTAAHKAADELYLLENNSVVAIGREGMLHI